MGRAKRASEGGLIYHVLNRAKVRLAIFEDEDKDKDDFEAFGRILFQAVERTGTELLAFCLMHNHWHLVVKPHEDRELSSFIVWTRRRGTVVALARSPITKLTGLR